MGQLPTVTGELQVGDTTTGVRQLNATDPDRVWVVLLWGGFRTGDDDGVPLQQILTREYVETEHPSLVDI